MGGMRRTVPRPPAAALDDLLALRPGKTWRFFASQDFAFWATCLYLVVEYVRPQQLIGALYGLPLGQIVLSAALLAFLGSGKWFAMKGLGSWLLVAYTVVIGLSSATAYDTSASIAGWRLWISWVVIYFLIVNVVNTRARFFVFMTIWLVSHYYMSQGAAKQFALRGFTFDAYGVRGAPGWFANSGEFGIAMCMFLPLAWHFYLGVRRHLSKLKLALVIGMPVTAAIGIMGSSSRGAVLGMLVVAVWAAFWSKYRVKAFVGGAMLLVAAWFVIPSEFKDRFTTAGEDYTSQTRKTFWLAGIDMVATHPVLGIGYGNWLPYYANHYLDPTAGKRDPTSRLQLPHNIFIECVAELGLVGLGVFLALIGATLRLNYLTRKRIRERGGAQNEFASEIAYGLDAAMIGYIVSGFFVTVLYYPFFWVNLALTTALHSAVAAEVPVSPVVPQRQRSRSLPAAAPQRLG
jgi:O-antigen ligase